MGASSECSSNLYKLPISPTLSALGSSLQQSLSNFKDLQIELEQLSFEVEKYKNELIDQKEKCESTTCVGSQALKKMMETKVAIINTVALTAVKLNETKNFTFLNEIFRILHGETTVTTPLKENRNIKTEHKTPSPSYTPEKNLTSPRKEFPKQIETNKDESVLEIEGTPGRVSPVIALKKKLKNSSSVSNVSGNLVDSKDKKKCPEEWPTPEAKQIRLNFPSPKHRKAGSGRMRQSRLDTVFTKATDVVDLTNSPECSRTKENLYGVKLLIKKESSDNDETILPSPTSGPGLPVNFLLSKTDAKENNQNFKKPISLSRTKPKIKEEVNSPIIQLLDKNAEDDEIMEMEHSINILQPNRFQNRPKSSPMKAKSRPLTSPKKFSPKKESKSPKNKSPKTSLIKAEPMEEDITHFDNASISILQQVKKLDVNQTVFKDNCISPTKSALGENINVTNMSSTQTNVEDSISILQNPKVTTSIIQDNNKRKTPEKVQPVYKELLPRKKAEKQALPAWLCDECKDVLNDLYSNDPDKVARIVARCSKHRGRTNPVRPKTPPGFWYPRWEVPEDTEEFNRRNNVEP